MRTTIKDIAKRAGVSNSLVSIYLNRRPLASRIAEATKQRIDEAVRALNYRPSATALALKNGRSKSLGLITGNICSDYNCFFAQTLLDECTKYGYQLLLGITHYNPEEELQCLENLLLRQADGIFYSMRIFPADYLNSIGLKDYPILQLSSTHPDFNSAGPALPEALKHAARQLHELGCRSIAIPHSSWAVILENEVKKYGMQIVGEHRSTSSEDFSWLRDSYPDAVAADSSIYIRLLLNKCKELGIKKVPYLVYSYSLPCDFIDDPRVVAVTVSDFREKIAGTVKRMIDMLEKPDEAIRHIEFPVRCLNPDEARAYCKEQLADPFYESFTLKSTYRTKEE